MTMMMILILIRTTIVWHDDIYHTYVTNYDNDGGNDDENDDVFPYCGIVETIY